MDTLISVGTLSAYAWSLFALFFGHAGMTGMTMRFELTLRRDTGAEHLYLEVASAVIVFLLAGRYFEGRSKREAGAALRALLSLGAKEATVLDERDQERLVPIHDLLVGDRFVVRSAACRSRVCRVRSDRDRARCADTRSLARPR